MMRNRNGYALLLALALSAALATMAVTATQMVVDEAQLLAAEYDGGYAALHCDSAFAAAVGRPPVSGVSTVLLPYPTGDTPSVSYRTVVHGDRVTVTATCSGMLADTRATFSSDYAIVDGVMQRRHWRYRQ